MYQWCEFKSRRGKKKNLTAQRSNSNTVWLIFRRIYIYIHVVSVMFLKCLQNYTHLCNLSVGVGS